MSSRADIERIRISLSAVRMRTFELYLNVRGEKLSSSEALELYTWNLKISSALLVPLHICEVVIRNAVAEAIENKYGINWPWSKGFERSLADPKCGYSSRNNLLLERERFNTTNKIIPELKFVFWQRMFTSRHDVRIWASSLNNCFPNSPDRLNLKEKRSCIYFDLDNIRGLRNRIAHHEPIFRRNLNEDFKRIENIIRWRCTDTAEWMYRNQQVRTLIGQRPSFLS